jgi:hypothetical protein
MAQSKTFPQKINSDSLIAAKKLVLTEF